MRPISTLATRGALAHDVERSHPISLGKRRKIEDVVNEGVHLEPGAKRHLSDVNQLRRTFAYDLHAEHAPTGGVRDQLEKAVFDGRNLTASKLFETRTSDERRTLCGHRFLFRQPDARHLRNRIDAE